MHYELIQDAAKFDALEHDWSDLLGRSGRNFLPMAHFWISIWWKNFGNGRQPKIHCFYEGSKLVAAAPMLLESTHYRRLPIQRMTAMANGHSPYSELLVDRDITDVQLAEMVTQIAASTLAHLTAFTHVPDDSPLYRLFQDRTSIGGHPLGFKPGSNTPLVRIDSDWDTFLGKRSAKFRKGIRSKVNRFHRTDGCTIECHPVAASSDPIMEQMLQVSRNSWKGKIGTDLGTMPGSRTFTADLIDRMGPEGGILVWMAWSGAQPIAYEFHAQYQGVTYPLRADYDENFREISPGSVVEYTALYDLFAERRLALYDSCANNYWYLSNWTSEYRTHIDVEIFRNSLTARGLHATEYRLIPALRRCRETLKKLRRGDKPEVTEPQ